MVLDPLSAIGLAGNVAQFVEFTCKTFSEGRRLYYSGDGALDENSELSTITSALASLSDKLSQLECDFSPEDQQPSESEKALQNMAKECSVIAPEFNRILDDLRLRGPNRKWRAFDKH